MSSRVTNGTMTYRAINYLHQNMTNIAKTQEKLSTQQNINRPSDDPVGLTRILDLSNTLRMDERYGRNISNATAEVNTADNALNNMVNLINRAQELTTQAANFTNNQDGRNAIALEIDEIINQLVQLGNTDISGKYLFGGLKSDTPPFSRTGNTVTFNGTPPTENWQNLTEISRGVVLTTNVNGQNVLGTTGGTGLFNTLMQLKTDLTTPGATQLSDIQSRLDQLTTDLNTVLTAQSFIGSVSNRLSLTEGRIEERKSILTQQYSSIQDIDMPATITNLNYQQNAFDASLSVTARLMQTSLLDYL